MAQDITSSPLNPKVPPASHEPARSARIRVETQYFDTHVKNHIEDLEGKKISQRLSEYVAELEDERCWLNGQMDFLCSKRGHGQSFL